jgi:hypothetical protein
MVATEDGKLIVYGGTNEQGFVMDDDFIFDPATTTWQSLDAAYKPSTGRYAHSATRVGGNKIFYFGGFGPDGVPLTGPRIYDIATNEWEAASPMLEDSSWGLPLARGYHGSALINETLLLIIGGRSKPLSDKSGANFTDVYLFDTERSAWQHATSAAVAAHTVTVVSGRVFVYGGTGAADAVGEIPLSIASVEQLLSGIAQYMHENKLSEGIQHPGEGRAKSRLRVLYEHERAQRIKLQARCALLENKLFNRSSAKQLSLELLVKQLREKDLEIAELKRKNEHLQRRFQPSASQEDQLRDIAADLAVLWQRHEETRRQREDALAALAASESAIKKQMQRFGAIIGEDMVAPLASRAKQNINNSAILTANSKRYSHNDAAALARSQADSGEKSEDYAKWLTSFNEKAAAEKASKSDRILETQPDMKPLDLNKLNSSGPASLRPHSPRRAESAVSPRVRSSSSSGVAPEISISAPPAKEPASSRGTKSEQPAQAVATPPLTPSTQGGSAAGAAADDKKKKDKKTLSEQFLAGKATFSRRFSQVTGKAKSLLQSAKEKDEKPVLKTSNSTTKLQKEDEEGVWQPPSTPTAVKPLPLSLNVLDKCLAYLYPRT